MLFVGDIALPFENAINFNSFPDEFYQKQWVANLEGSIIHDSHEDHLKKRDVFNDSKAIESLLDKFNIPCFLLANNHLLDVANLETTTNFLKGKTSYIGAGKDLKDANKSFKFKENGTEVILLNFGWEVIQCEIATKDKEGVNPLHIDYVLETVRNTIKNNPNSKVVPIMHWSYELEAEPQPRERELAKSLIEIGAQAVIGAHPHRIGGFEIYKNKPIVYSLGNWLFKQDHYDNGKLKFPSFCDEELAFEMDFKTGEFHFHFFNYNKEKNTLSYINTEDKSSAKMTAYTPFRDLNNEDYKTWYKANHHHKNKGLPVFYWEDSNFQVNLKNKWNKWRDRLLDIYLILRDQ